MDILSKLQMEMTAKEHKSMMQEYEKVVNVIHEANEVTLSMLIKAGFDEEQAFELVKEHGVNIGKLI